MIFKHGQHVVLDAVAEVGREHGGHRLTALIEPEQLPVPVGRPLLAGPPLDVGGLPDRAGRPRLAHPLQEHRGQAQGFRSVPGDHAVRGAHD
jgi:hypothetical protein